MADPWNASFRTPSPGSSSEEEGPQTPVYARLSRDAELARELDLASREDTAVYKPTPFTIAKVNAHHASITAQKKALYRKTSSSSSSSDKAHGNRGPVPALLEEAAPAPTAIKRNGPVPVIGTDALAKKPVEKNGWAKSSVWKTAENVPIPASAPPPKEVKAKGRGKKKDEGEVTASATEQLPTKPLSRMESLLKGIDDQVIAQQAEDTTKGKKGKGKAKPRAPSKRKKVGDEEQDAEGGPKPKKRGRKKKEEEAEKISFGRIPAGATDDSEFPIMQSLAKQKKLPTKTSAKATKTPRFTAPKPKAMSKAKAPKKKAFTSLSFLSDSSHDDVIASISLSNLFPPSTKDDQIAGSKKIEALNSAEDAEEVDELINSDDEDHAPPEEEKEGKAAVMSKFFGTSTFSTKIDDVPLHTGEGKSRIPGADAQDAPSTMTHVNFTFEERKDQESPTKEADTSSSQLPYSSPLAGKPGSNLKASQNGSVEILEPKPIRHKGVVELSALGRMDEDAMRRLWREQKKLVEKQAEEDQKGATFKLPDLPKSEDPSPTRKPGFSESGVFASQQVKSSATGVASALGKYAHAPYAHPSFERKPGGASKTQSKWAAPPSYAGNHRVAPLPSDFDRKASHFRGGRSRTKSHIPIRSPSPPAVPVGGHQYQLKQVWTPSAPTQSAETYRIESSQNNLQYGATVAPQPNVFGPIGSNGQPRFRVQNQTQPTFQRSAFDPYAKYHNQTINVEQEANWEDQWKKQNGAYPTQPRIQPVPRLNGTHGIREQQQRTYIAPTSQPTRFAVPAQQPIRVVHGVTQARLAARGNTARRRF